MYDPNNSWSPEGHCRPYFDMQNGLRELSIENSRREFDRLMSPPILPPPPPSHWELVMAFKEALRQIEEAERLASNAEVEGPKR